jgi:hypothetical protein
MGMHQKCFHKNPKGNCFIKMDKLQRFDLFKITHVVGRDIKRIALNRGNLQSFVPLKLLLQYGKPKTEQSRHFLK